MTKKDYELLANAMQDAFNMAAWCLDNQQDRLSFTRHLADALEANPGFDRQKFIWACAAKEYEADDFEADYDFGKDTFIRDYIND